MMKENLDKSGGGIIRYAPGFLKLLDLAAQSSHNRTMGPRRGRFPSSLEDFRWSAITPSDSKHLCVRNTSLFDGESHRRLMKMTEAVSLTGEIIRKKGASHHVSHV